LLTDVGAARAWSLAYDNGVLEIRMPYQEQEFPVIILAYLVNAIADELEIEAMQVGALLREKEELQRDRTGHLFLHPASNFSYKQSCRESKFYSYHRN